VVGDPVIMPGNITTSRVADDVGMGNSMGILNRQSVIESFTIGPR
jgi:hypothetical protein